MGSSLFISTTLFLFTLIFGFSCSEYVTPPFSASNLQFIEDHGAFLYSDNRTFKAAIYNPGNQQARFYFCVIHIASHTIIWSANRDSPVSNSGKLVLSSNGVILVDENGREQWSTPHLQSSVSSLSLTEAGNLVLLDVNNVTLWDSFDHPSDTVVIGQKLAVGTALTSSVSNNNLFGGSYSLSITTVDAMLKWDGSTYWKLSMANNAYTNANYVVEYLAVDANGLYLFGQNGSVVVMQVNLPLADFRMANLDSDGRFTVSSYSGSSWKEEFAGPVDDCKIPFICGKIGLCTISAGSNSPSCSCPSGFRADPNQVKGCLPSDNSLSLPVSCNSSSNKGTMNPGNVSYLALGGGKGYFAITFSDPVKYGMKLSSCQYMCAADCSCLACFYGNSSGSCYIVQNQLGSVMSNSADINALGYIKTVVSGNAGGNEAKSRRSLSALVVIPSAGLIAAIALGILVWRKWKNSKTRLGKLSNLNSPTSEEMEAFSIPGLPVRYDYESLNAATGNFRDQIGSGGFGVVYKGILLDGTAIAVKKLTNLGVQGKKEFCTEIAIIVKLHHVNLVKLNGFCVQGSERLLVYEFMNRGSLDRTLFGTGPVLEWQERFDVALGTARGLAYLHSGCENKIIHCDVKPENILLQDNFHPKVSDFGLSKLLSPEQSSHFTTMRGTRGYLAPEWLTSSAISEKTDVYSYGMVLLELVSGRKNCSSLRQQSHSLDEDSGNSSQISSGSEVMYFPMLALEMHEQGRYSELADPRLEGRVTNEEVEKLVRIALCCVNEEPFLRPSMVHIVAMLEGRIPTGRPRLESLNFLRFYGRRFSEPSILPGGEEQSDLRVHRYNALGSGSGGSIIHNSGSYDYSQQLSGPR